MIPHSAYVIVLIVLVDVLDRGIKYLAHGMCNPLELYSWDHQNHGWIRVYAEIDCLDCRYCNGRLKFRQVVMGTAVGDSS